MRTLRMRLALLVLLGFVFPASAQVVQISGAREETYVPSLEECTRFDICDLTKIIFRRQNVFMPSMDAHDVTMYWTRIYASYVTQSVSTIEKYAFVQFIRGCMFTSEILPAGMRSTRFELARRYMDTPDGRLAFRHLDWMIDSDEADPVYSSAVFSKDRFFYLQWTEHPEIWNADESGKLYGLAPPTFPQVYVTDSPSAAVLFPDGRAINSSLEFRMCLYRAGDVPPSTYGSNVHFATPIKCFEWSQSFVYDHKTQKWGSPVGIAATCNRPLSEQEQTQFESLKTYRKDWNPIKINSTNPEQK